MAVNTEIFRQLNRLYDITRELYFVLNSAPEPRVHGFAEKTEEWRTTRDLMYVSMGWDPCAGPYWERFLCRRPLPEPDEFLDIMCAERDWLAARIQPVSDSAHTAPSVVSFVCSSCGKATSYCAESTSGDVGHS